MKVSSTVIVVFVVMISMLLVNCGGQIPEASTPIPIQVDTSQPLVGEMILDPAIASVGNHASETIISLVYEPLLRNIDGNLEQGLANAWQESEDGLEYSISLRPDAIFTDGTPITSDIVIANFNRWFDPAYPNHGSGEQFAAWKTYFFGFKGEVGTDNLPVAVFDGVEKIDPLNLLVHLNRAMPEFLFTLALPQFSIINPANLVESGASFGTTIESVNPSGPYIITKWEAGTIELSPNSKYFGAIPEENVIFTLTP